MKETIFLKYFKVGDIVKILPYPIAKIYGIEDMLAEVIEITEYSIKVKLLNNMCFDEDCDTFYLRPRELMKIKEEQKENDTTKYRH